MIDSVSATKAVRTMK